MSTSDVLGIAQAVITVALIGGVVFAVRWSLRQNRRRPDPFEALDTARNDHDWNCTTGPWPHDGDCVPMPDTGWFGQQALEECTWLLGNTVQPATRREDERCVGE
jgi:hypothetical protein